MREMMLSTKRLYLVMYIEGILEVAGSREPVNEEMIVLQKLLYSFF